MDATADLIRLLTEWRKLTENEGAAISRNDWAAVAEQQNLKAQLRQRLTPAIEALRSTEKTGPCAGKEDDTFDSIISELVALEMRNLDRLRVRRQARQENLDQLNATVRNLRELRRAYSRGRPPVWQSYS